MTRDERDRLEDDGIENEVTENPSSDEQRGLSVDSDSDEFTRAEQSDASGEQSPGAGNIGDSESDEAQDTLPGDEAAAAAISEADNLGPPDAVAEVAAELPPPEPLPTALASNSSIALPAEPTGISFGELSSQASPADAEAAFSDVTESVPAPSPGDLVEQAFLATDATRGPRVPPAAQDDARRESQDSSPIRQLPFVMEVGGERRVQKRLEIEVEVTVINQERIAAVTSNKTMGTFSRLANFSVYKVAEDLRRFRESYRDAWGR